MVRACAHGAKPPAIARLLDADPDTVRDVIHAFNAYGLVALDPQWGLGCPRRITLEDEEFIAQVATTRPRAVGRPFAHWSLRKLADYLADNPVRVVVIHRERLRQILHTYGISFPAHENLEGTTDPDADAKLDRIERVLGRWPDRCFAFDQFGPLSIRPCHCTCWAHRRHPDRIRANYHRVHGIGYFHGCYD
jgi:transposase